MTHETPRVYRVTMQGERGPLTMNVAADCVRSAAARAAAILARSERVAPKQVRAARCELVCSLSW